MSIDRDTVRQYAALANLTFSDEEADLLAGHLTEILGHVAKLNELDLGNTIPTQNVHQHTTPIRDDQVRDSLGQAIALANAPDQESGHFLVPKVIKK